MAYQFSSGDLARRIISRKGNSQRTKRMSQTPEIIQLKKELAIERKVNEKFKSEFLAATISATEQHLKEKEALIRTIAMLELENERLMGSPMSIEESIKED